MLVIFIVLLLASGVATALTPGSAEADCTCNIPLELLEELRKDHTFRTINQLDVLVLNNENRESKADYEPTGLNTLIKESPEAKFADIVERRNMDGDEYRKEDVKTNAAKSRDAEAYSGKVRYLVDKNILSRDKYYTFVPEGTVIEKDKDSDEGKKVRFYDPEELMAKTEFLTYLMKTDKVFESRPVANRTNYGRYGANFNFQVIDREPLELSPYQKEMEKMGIDSALSDVIVNYSNFGTIDMTISPDVFEFYLANAIRKGIIKYDDIANIKEGRKFKKEVKSDGTVKTNSSGDLIPSYEVKEPVRLNYKKFQLSTKHIEKDDMEAGNYPEDFYEFQTVLFGDQGSVTKDDKQAMKDTFPWGSSYDYINLKTGARITDSNVFSRSMAFAKQWIGVFKKDSVLTNTNGYQYFIDENITLADAYVLVYKFVRATGAENTLSKNDIDNVNAKFSPNLAGMNSDQGEAIKYLIAKGIIDGDDPGLLTSYGKPLNNEMAAEILYKLNNKVIRKVDKTPLTSTDREMLESGFNKSQMSISPYPTTSANFEVKEASEFEPGVSGLVAGKLASLSGVDQSNTKMPEYSLVFVRVPDELVGRDTKLVTDDTFRKVSPVAKSRQSQDGQIWNMYVLHNTTSANMMMVGSSNYTFYTLRGINGEALYYPEENKPNGKFEKIAIPFPDLNDQSVQPNTKVPREIKKWINDELGVKTKKKAENADNYTKDYKSAMAGVPTLNTSGAPANVEEPQNVEGIQEHANKKANPEYEAKPNLEDDNPPEPLEKEKSEAQKKIDELEKKVKDLEDQLKAAGIKNLKPLESKNKRIPKITMDLYLKTVNQIAKDDGSFRNINPYIRVYLKNGGNILDLYKNTRILDPQTEEDKELSKRYKDIVTPLDGAGLLKNDGQYVIFEDGTKTTLIGPNEKVITGKEPVNAKEIKEYFGLEESVEDIRNYFSNGVKPKDENSLLANIEDKSTAYDNLPKDVKKESALDFAKKSDRLSGGDSSIMIMKNGIVKDSKFTPLRSPALNLIKVAKGDFSKYDSSRDIPVAKGGGKKGLFGTIAPPTLPPQAPEDRRVVKYGPVREGSMAVVKFDNKALLMKSGNKWYVNKDALPRDFYGRVDVVDHPKVLMQDGRAPEKQYDILFFPKSQNYAEEVNSFRSRITGHVTDPRGKFTGTKVNTYIQYSKDGQTPIVMINSKDVNKITCPEDNAENTAGSCLEVISKRAIKNKKTGQVLYLDDEGSLSIVGNNVSKYDTGKLLGNSTSDDFFRLDSVLELIDNADVAVDYKGKDIGQAPADITYARKKIFDEEDKKKVGSVYTARSGEDIYMSLTSLPQNLTNSIFFKNKVKGREYALLITYSPKTGFYPSKGTDNTVRAKYRTVTENGSELDKRRSMKQDEAQKMILQYLFSDVKRKDPEDITGGIYDYNIFVLDRYEGKRATDQIRDFLKDVTGDNTDKMRQILENVSIDSKLEVPHSITDDSLSTKIAPIEISSDFTRILNYDKNTGNLFVRVSGKGDITGAEETLAILDDAYQFNINDNRIDFVKTHFYSNTPKGFVPLEIYAKNPSKLGGAASSNPGETITNFNYRSSGLETGVHWRMPSDRITNRVSLIKDGVIGSGTIVEAPIRPIKIDEITKEEDGQFYDPINKIRATNLLFAETVKAFREINSDYNVLGALITPTIGYDGEKEFERAQFMKGSMLGVLPNYGDSEYAMNNFFMDEKNIEKALSAYPELNKSDYEFEGKKAYGLMTGRTLSNTHIRFMAGSAEQKKVVNTANKKLKDFEGTVAASRVRDNRIDPDMVYSLEFDVMPDKSLALRKIYPIDERFGAAKKYSDSRIFIKPSLVIPDGTTLVDPDGKLVFAPNKIPREEIGVNKPAQIYQIEMKRSKSDKKKFIASTMTPMLNAILGTKPAYASQTTNNTAGIKKNTLYLSDIPEGSQITIGDSGNYLIKTSSQQDITSGNRTKWVKVMTVPNKDTEEVRVSEFNNMSLYNEFERYSNLKIPLEDTGKMIDFKELNSKGVYKLPEKDDITKYIDPYERNYKDIKKNANYIPVIKNTTKTQFTPDFMRIKSDDKGKSVVAKEGDSDVPETIKPVLSMMLPPSMMVKKLDDGTYSIVGYSSTKNFNTGSDPWTKQTMKVANEEESDLGTEMKVYDITRIDGRLYLGYLNSAKAAELLERANAFIKNLAMPLACIICLWFMIIYIIGYLPIIRNAIVGFYETTDIDILKVLSFGRVSLYSPSNFIKISIACVIVMAVAIIYVSGIAEAIIVNIFRLFTYIRFGE